MIEQKKISLISNRTTSEGGKRVPETVIERDYCLSWFLFGLAQSPLRSILIFKGGTALRRCYFEDYRFSEDLDFSLREFIEFEQISVHFPKIFEFIKNEVGMEFSSLPPEEPSENTYTFSLIYKGPLPGDPKVVKVDITFKENILFEPQAKGVIQTYEEYSDFLKDPTVMVYALEEVAVEKVCALFSAARNEPRDLYDIHALITDKNLKLTEITDEIFKKMEFKGLPFDKRKGEFEKKEARLRNSWKKRLAHQMSMLPEFEDVYRAVKRSFRQAGLTDTERGP